MRGEHQAFEHLPLVKWLQSLSPPSQLAESRSQSHCLWECSSSTSGSASHTVTDPILRRCQHSPSETTLVLLVTLMQPAWAAVVQTLMDLEWGPTSVHIELTRWKHKTEKLCSKKIQSCRVITTNNWIFLMELIPIKPLSIMTMTWFANKNAAGK